jgi:hypothetical protein
MAKQPSRPTLERQAEYETERRRSLAMYGPVGDDYRTSIEDPLTYVVPEYVWDDIVFRYRWRKETVIEGKNVSWNFYPVPGCEREIYNERLAVDSSSGRENGLTTALNVPNSRGVLFLHELNQSGKMPAGEVFRALPPRKRQFAFLQWGIQCFVLLPISSFRRWSNSRLNKANRRVSGIRVPFSPRLESPST